MAATPLPTTIGPTFGALLRTYRMRAGLTQEALAERSGLSARGISDLERGLKRAPRRDTVALLLNALELAPDEQASLIAAARAPMSRPNADLDIGRKLPVPVTALIGRDREVAAVIALVRHGARLLTLIGPGGVGKTRLALAAAQQLEGDVADRVLFVDLAPVRDSGLVLPTIASAVGLRDTGTSGLAESLALALGHAHHLLILDNCEQVVGAAGEIAGLVAACPNLAIIATSRIALRLGAEQVVPVPPLDLPDPQVQPPLDELAQSPAVALFAARATAADPTFALTEANAADVAALVRRLDGLPLAIELAAARSHAFPPSVLVARLDRQLSLLTGGARDAPARQRTMRDTIAWSENLLSPEGQVLLRRLSVFVGGFALEAAEAVGNIAPRAIDVLERLAELADASLLRQEAGPAGVARYRMLEVVREFGLEELTKSGEEPNVRAAHASWYETLLAPAAKGGFLGTRELEWLERFGVELGNLRAALTWALDDGGDPMLGLRLAAAPWWFWLSRGGLTEGIDWLEQALARGSGAPPGARAEALLALGILTVHRPDYERAETALKEALSIFEGIGDPTWIALAELVLGLNEQGRERLERSNTLYADALDRFEAGGDTALAAWVRFFLGVNARLAGDLDRAQTFMTTALHQAREARSGTGIATCLGGIGATAFLQGDLDRATTFGCQSLALRYQIGERAGVAEQLIDLAKVAAERGDHSRAVRMYASAYSLRAAHGIDSLRFDRARDAGFVQGLRDVLSEEAFASAWEGGRDLAAAEAVAEALGMDGQTRPTGPDEHDAIASNPYGLTDREVEILRLLVAGKTDRQIADALYISPRTVATHMSNIFGKMGVANRVQAATVAVQADLV